LWRGMPKHVCKKCGREFQSSRALSSHMRDKHPSTYYSRRLMTIGIVAVLLASAGLGLIYSGLLFQPPPQQPRAGPISGIRCDSLEHTTYHVHTLLEIYVNGEKRVVPREIGIIPGVCLYWLHTHDTTGLIHIEAPEERKFTLGQFFDVWGQPLSKDRVWDIEITNGKELRVYVDGKPYTGDPREIELQDGRIIVLDIGPPFRTPA